MARRRVHRILRGGCFEERIYEDGRLVEVQRHLLGPVEIRAEGRRRVGNSVGTIKARRLG